MNRNEIVIGGNTPTPLVVRRPGYGTMRLTGPDVWGEPTDRNGAIMLIRKAADLGVNFFDTADFYGPGVTNRLLAEALYPYAPDVIITTKVGTSIKHLEQNIKASQVSLSEEDIAYLG